jgi:tetratricopeptide (TPR) repeat protein
MKHLNDALLVVLMVMMTAVQTVHADPATQAFLDGIKLYKQDKYAEAAAEFSKIADQGIINGKLFYNLGNAYLKSGDTGHAMLWYERSLKLMPHDPDLNFNYEYAQSLIRDEKGEKQLPIFRILFFWKYLMSQSQVQWTAIGLNLIFWTLLAVGLIREKCQMKTLNTVVLTLTLIFTLTACYNHYETHFQKEAVILPAKVSIRSGLTDDATELFVLHAGTKVKVDKEKDDYFQIVFSEGKIGWIKKADAAVI